MITKEEYLETSKQAAHLLVMTDVATQEENDYFTIIIGKMAMALARSNGVELIFSMPENLPDQIVVDHEIEAGFRQLMAFVRKNMQ